MQAFCLSAKRNKPRNKLLNTVHSNSIDIPDSAPIYNVLT
jgi:hypothetical protein